MKKTLRLAWHSLGARIALAFVTVLVCVVALAACGSGEQTGGNEASSPVESSSSEQAASSSATSSQEKDASKGVWVITKETVEQQSSTQGDDGEDQTTTVKQVIDFTLGERGEKTAAKISASSNGEEWVQESTLTSDENGYTKTAKSVLYKVGDEDNKTNRSETTEFEYDDQGRVTKATVKADDDSTEEIVAYEYDDDGNISKRTRTSSEKGVDPDTGEYMSDYSVVVTYDKYGFPTSEHVEMSNSLDPTNSVVGDTVFTYEGGEEGRPATTIAEGKTSDGSTTENKESYTYDDNGNIIKVERDITYSDGYTTHSVTTREYTYVENPSTWPYLSNRLKYLP